MNLEKFAEYILIAIFFIVYMLIINFLWNNFFRIDSSFTAVIGTIVALLISITLAALSANKVTAMIQRWFLIPSKKFSSLKMD